MTSIVRFALGLCAFAFLTYSAVPGLLRDTAHRGDWQPTHEWAAEKAKCTVELLRHGRAPLLAVGGEAPSGLLHFRELGR